MNTAKDKLVFEVVYIFQYFMILFIPSVSLVVHLYRLFWNIHLPKVNSHDRSFELYI